MIVLQHLFVYSEKTSNKPPGMFAMNNISKIKKISATMMVCCSTILLVIPLWIVWFWATFEHRASGLSFMRPNVLIDMQYIGVSQLMLGAAVHAIMFSVLLFGIWHLRLLFQSFKNGVFFTREAVRHLHIFTMTLFIGALLKPVSSALLSVILTIGNPPGQKSLVIEFGSHELATIFIAGTLMAITWIMREGQVLAAENAEFV